MRSLLTNPRPQLPRMLYRSLAYRRCHLRFRLRRGQKIWLLSCIRRHHNTGFICIGLVIYVYCTVCVWTSSGCSCSLHLLGLFVTYINAHRTWAISGQTKAFSQISLGWHDLTAVFVELAVHDAIPFLTNTELMTKDIVTPVS